MTILKRTIKRELPEQVAHRQMVVEFHPGFVPCSARRIPFCEQRDEREPFPRVPQAPPVWTSFGRATPVVRSSARGPGKEALAAALGYSRYRNRCQLFSAYFNWWTVNV